MKMKFEKKKKNFLRLDSQGQAGAETFGKSFIKKLPLDDSGQAGAVFRLMIDAIIGLVILAMIMTTLNYFLSLRVEASKAEFIEKAESMVQSPNGKVLTTGVLLFMGGENFSANQLQALTGYSYECFSFQTRAGLVDIGLDNRSVTFRNNLETKAYFRCISCTTFEGKCENSDCEIECVISIGKTLDPIEH